MDIQVKAKSAWLLYFALSIALIGGVLAYGLVIPLYLLGYFYAPAVRTADRVMRDGIWLLMSVQPWFRGEIDPRLSELSPAARGCLLVSNHRSNLDVFILLSRIQGIRVLAKNSLFFIPFLGLMMRLSKQIPVRRGSTHSFLDAMDTACARIAGGDVVHVFPEMTRCERGFKGTLHFSLAPFRMAKRAEIPVIPIVFEGTDEVWPKSSLGLRFRKPVKVRALPALDPRDFSSSQDLMLEARRRIEQALGA